MKNILLLFVLISTFGNAQNQRFSYIYQFVRDSTKHTDIRSEMMFLEVLPKFSKFYSQDVFQSDSIINATLEKELKATGSINIKLDMRKGAFRNVIIKESPDFTTCLITRIGRTEIKVADDRKINWKILPEKQKTGEFETQKAETEIYGRKWTAWFTTAIPIQDGPYKFHSLPGLIVKIEDQTKSHSFALNGIKNLSSEEIKNIDPNKNFVFKSGAPIEMNLSQYKKFFLENRNDPNRALRSALSQNEMTKINVEGKMMDSAELMRNNEKKQKERLAKDNNLLELDLLK